MAQRFRDTRRASIDAPAPKSALMPAAPPWAHRFRSDDPDEVREFVGRFVGSHSRVTYGAGPLGFRQNWLSGATAVVGWVGSGVRTVVRGALPGPTLHLSVPVGSVYRYGRQQHRVTRGAVTFLAPGWEYTLDRPPGPSLGLSVDAVRLAEEVDSRLAGQRGSLALKIRSIEPDDAVGRALAAALTQVVWQTDPASSGLPGGHGNARIIGVLAAMLLTGAAASRVPVVTAARLADLEAWIEANLDQPITVGRLCRVAGTGERALQKAFEARRGMSPMRFVTERRLAAARHRLEAAGALDGVTAVAVSLGFGHVGRFAQMYRQAFGETPSQSLRRVRR